MAKKKKKQNIPAIVITAVAALLAIAAVVFLIKTISSEEDREPEQSSTPTEDPGFIPEQDLITETEQAAYNLLPENYKIYQYITLGMSVKEEPYGNLPEDGFYTCVNEDYPTFEDFSEYVHSVFVDSVAEKLLTDPFGNGPVYGDDNGELGISVDFEPTAEEGLSWADVHFVCTPVSETECHIEVTLQDADGKDVVREVQMVLEDGSWKLSDIVC